MKGTTEVVNTAKAPALPRTKLENFYNTFRKKAGKIIINAIVYILLIEFVFVFVFPYLYMIINSFKYDFDMRDTNTEWIVTRLNQFNYTRAISDLNYWQGLRNNVLVSVLSMIGHVISGSFIAYGLARFKFPGRNFVFMIILLSVIIPPNTLLIPLYIQFAKFNLFGKIKFMGNPLPIVVPTFFGFGLKGGLFIFIFRQYFKGLPQSYEESARLEGCGNLGIFFKIILPLAKTGMVVVGILSTIWHWNDYFEPTVYLKGQWTLLFQRMGNIDYWMAVHTADGKFINTIVLAACVLITAPLLLIYFLFQKQFMKGIEYTGLAN